MSNQIVLHFTVNDVYGLDRLDVDKHEASRVHTWSLSSPTNDLQSVMLNCLILSSNCMNISLV